MHAVGGAEVVLVFIKHNGPLSEVERLHGWVRLRGWARLLLAPLSAMQCRACQRATEANIIYRVLVPPWGHRQRKGAPARGPVKVRKDWDVL